MRLTSLLLVVLLIILLTGVLAMNRSVWVVVLAGMAVLILAGMLGLTRRG